MPLAWLAALLARHSSSHAFTVFCCASAGPWENASADMSAIVAATTEIRFISARVLEAFVEFGFVGSARERLAVMVDRSRLFAAGLDARCLGGAGQRLAVLADGVRAGRRLRHRRAGSKGENETGEKNAFQFFLHR